MKMNGVAIAVLASGLMILHPSLSRAQSPQEEKSKAEAHANSDAHPTPTPEARSVKVTPLKMLVVLTEYEGEKKVKSLPYSFIVDSDRNSYQFTKMRIGTKVPVYSGKEGGMQYIDVGTNIDCRATRGDAGTFRVELVIERSWVDGEVSVPLPKGATDDKSDASGQFKEPIIRQFKTEMEASLVDGQTAEITHTTDPMSGKMLKIEATLTVLK
jgi:hypothetical protein